MRRPRRLQLRQELARKRIKRLEMEKLSLFLRKTALDLIPMELLFRSLANLSSNLLPIPRIPGSSSFMRHGVTIVKL